MRKKGFTHQLIRCKYMKKIEVNTLIKLEKTVEVAIEEAVEEAIEEIFNFSFEFHPNKTEKVTPEILISEST
jgi:hypothetical protein